MSNTTKVVLIVVSVLVVCIIGAAVTLGLVYSGTGHFSLGGLFKSSTIDVDESADFNLDGVTRLNIQNVSGRIFVKPGEPGVTLTGRVMTNSEQEQFLSVKTEGDTLTIKSDIDTFYPNFINGDLVLTVYVPEDMGIDTAVSSTSASTEISGISFGSLSVQSTSGTISVADCAGSTMKIGVTSGGVKVGQLDFSDVDVNCTSGSVSVEDVTGSVKAGSTSGAVRVVNAAGTVEISNTSGSATLMQAHQDIQPVRINTVSGSIKVTLNPGSAFDIDVETTSGGFSTDYEVTVSGKLSSKVVGEDISGKVNGGGSMVQMSTVSGGISLNKAELAE